MNLEAIQRMAARYPDLAGVAGQAEAVATALAACFRAGGKLLMCGNGGSAADAEHVVGELMKGYLRRRPAPAELRQALEAADSEAGRYIAGRLQGALPAISLVSHTGLMTAIANDIAGDMIFAQQVYGYGRPGDALMAVSTSGNSPNVLHALRVARALGLTTIGFTGRGQSRLPALCDIAVCVPFDKTAEIQERHLALYHAICEAVEVEMFPE